MKIRVIILISLLISFQALSQVKHTFSLGGGVEKMHNSYLSPYNMKGVRFFNVMYDKEKQLNSKWKTLMGINIGASSLNIDYDFANKLEKGPFNADIDASINKTYLLELFDYDKFRFFGGFIASLQGNYQLISYTPIVYSDIIYYDFFTVGMSGGISASTQLRLKKIVFQNTTSCLLLNAILHPNYSSDFPLIYGTTKDYLTFSSLNKRFYLSNKLQIDFPLYINDKLINSFSFSYVLNYDNSVIKDNSFSKLVHSFNLGVIFKVEKLNILSGN